MSALEKLLKSESPLATSATSATQTPESSNSSECSRGVVLDFDLEKARRDAETRAEARNKRLKPVLKMMAEDKGAKAFHFVTDDKPDPEYVVVPFAIPGKGSGELSIPRKKYDPGRLMDVLANARKDHDQ